MFFIFIFLVPLVFFLVPNNLFWLSWVNFNLVLTFFQVFIIFSAVKLFFSKNIYELVLWSFLVIFTLTLCLFVYQLDVFACFLLVSETVVIFFILTFIIHVNHTNLPLGNSKVYLHISTILLAYAFFNVAYFDGSSFSYRVLWYTSQISSYNDLLSQYIYLYTLNSYLTLIVGFWLLLLTFFLVLTVTASSHSSTNTSVSNYFLKKQNLWKQWCSSPFLKFFK